MALFINIYLVPNILSPASRIVIAADEETPYIYF